MNRDFKGIWIPKEIWLNKEITIQEKVFIVEIDSLDNESGCFASNKYFAEFFNISTGRVSQIINSLIQKGLIKRTLIYKKDSKEIQNRVLNVSTRPSPRKLQDPPLEKLNTPPLGNDKDNNTDINNTFNNNKYRDESFNRFYATYPKRRAKGQALKAWNKLWKENKLPEINELLSIVEKWKKTEEWKKSDIKFIKYPATWLNGYGWEDELPEEIHTAEQTEEERHADIRRRMEEARRMMEA